MVKEASLLDPYRTHLYERALITIADFNGESDGEATPTFTTRAYHQCRFQWQGVTCEPGRAINSCKLMILFSSTSKSDVEAASRPNNAGGVDLDVFLTAKV